MQFAMQRLADWQGSKLKQKNRFKKTAESLNNDTKSSNNEIMGKHAKQVCTLCALQ